MTHLPRRILLCGLCILALTVVGCQDSKPIVLPKEQPLSVEVNQLSKYFKKYNINPSLKHEVTFYLAFADVMSCNSASASAEASGFQATWYSSPEHDYLTVYVSSRLVPNGLPLEQAIKRVREIARANGGNHINTHVEPLRSEGLDGKPLREPASH